MSLSSSPITRTPSPAERSSQRSERAPAGDFATLLELVPTPVRAPLARGAEHRDPDRGAGDTHDDRRDRRVPAPPRWPRARPDAGRPAATPAEHAPPPGHAVGAGPVVAEAAAGSTTARTAAVPEAPAPADVASPQEATAPLHDLIGVVGAPATEAAVTVVVAAQPIALVVPGSPATPAGVPAATFAPRGAAVLAAPDGAGAPTAAAGSPAFAGVPVDAAALSDGTLGGAVPAAAAASAPTVPVAAPVAAGPVATEVPVTQAGPVTDAAAAAVGTPGVETIDAEPGTPAGPEPAPSDLPTGTGTGSAGARDGRTGGGPSPEVAEAPSGASAPTPLPGSVGMNGAAAFGPHRSLPLERAPRAVAQLLHVASQQGVSHARIALRPVELGGIEIFLQVSPAGLAAQLVAESPEAARMLAQATEDLRRSLAAQNVELVSLDVSTSAEQQQRDELAARGFVPDDGMPGGRPAPRRADGSPGPASATPDPTTPTVIELPDGLLVDVLA